MKYFVFTLGIFFCIFSFMQADVVTYDATQDTEVYEDSPDANYGDEPLVEVYADWEDLPVLNSKALFQFPVEATYDIVIQAFLRLYVVGNHHDNGPIAIFRAAESWSEMTVNWNNRPSGNYEHQVTDNAPEVILDPVLWEIDVTDIVQAWEDGEPNYGFYLEVPDNNNWVGVDLATKENPDADIRPKLWVDYWVDNVDEDATPVIPAMSVTPVSAGSALIKLTMPESFAATLAIYDATGSLVKRFPVDRETLFYTGEAGIYFVVLEMPGQSIVRKTVIID